MSARAALRRDALVRDAHLCARAALAAGASYATPVPSSHDVLAALRRAGGVASRADVVETCAALGLPLADFP